MDAFTEAVLARLPLAESVGRLLKHALDDELMKELFQRHRGCGSEQKVTFAMLAQVITSALVEHGGSGRRSFHEARRAGRLEATDQAVYGKLRRVPVPLSEALLRAATQRLARLLPPLARQVTPPSLAGYRVAVIDGKAIKNLPKRARPLRGVSGKALGGKALVGLCLQQQLIVAMHASRDGEANDAPLAPGLVEQLADGADARPLLVIADRQFCDLSIPRRLAEGGGAFLIRYSKKLLFSAEKEQSLVDAQGRPARQAWGWLGAASDPRRLWVRQIAVERGSDEPILLVTNLLDDEAAGGADLLEAYRARWTIERVFQLVAEVFGLKTLIGSTPEGAIFQFALCALLYNLIQVVQAHIAAARDRPPRSLSGEMIFRDVQKQFIAGSMLAPGGQAISALHDLKPDELRAHLTRLLAPCWSTLWIKTTGRRRPPPTLQPLPGGHCSAHKLIQQHKTQSRNSRR
jgi:hypothetical protein